MEPGQALREDDEYARHGTANLFVWVEPLAGRRRILGTERHTASDFAEALRVLVDQDYPDAEQIVRALDNRNIHKAARLYERFEPQEAHRIAQKIAWPYTPEHGSWRNMAACELSGLARPCLCRRIPDFETLAREVAAWEARRNQAQTTIDWRFTTEDARIKLKRLYPIVKEQNSI